MAVWKHTFSLPHPAHPSGASMGLVFTRGHLQALVHSLDGFPWPFLGFLDSPIRENVPSWWCSGEFSELGSLAKRPVRRYSPAPYTTQQDTHSGVCAI